MEQQEKTEQALSAKKVKEMKKAEKRKQKEAKKEQKAKNPGKKRKKAPVIIAAIIIVLIVIRMVSCAFSGNAGVMVSTTNAFRGDIEENVSTSGKVASEEKTVLFAPVSGRLSEINVAAGDAVKAGDVLMTYDMDQMEQRLQEASLQQDKSNASYNSTMTENSKSTAKLNEANTNLAVLDQQLTDYKAYLKELQDKLSTSQRETQRQLSEESYDLSRKAADLNKELQDGVTAERAKEINKELQDISSSQARNSYVQSIANSSDYVVSMQNEIATVQEHITECENYKAEMQSQKGSSEGTILNGYQSQAYAADKDLAQLTYQEAQEQYDAAKKGIVADFDGIVTECTGVSGASVTEGAQLITLESSQNVKVSFDASKSDVAKLAIGQKVDITISGNKYEGEISKINRMATLNASNTPMVGVEVHLTNPDDKIILGLDAKLTVHTNSAQDTLLIPVEAINADKNGDFLYVIENGMVVKRAITCGISSDEYTEVLDGITDGCAHGTVGGGSMTQVWEYIKIALMNIRSNKGRSILTMLGIIIGISSVIMIISIGNGVKSGINGELNSMAGGQIAVYSNDTAENGTEVIFTEEDMDAIQEKVPNVKAVTPSWSFSGSATGRKGTFDAAATFGKAGLEYSSQDPIIKGRYFTDSDYYTANKVCVITESSAKTLFGNTNVIGMSFDYTLYGVTQEFTIVGIRKDNASKLFGMGGNGTVTMEAPISTISEGYGFYVDYTDLLIVSDGADNASQVAKDVVRLLENRHGVRGQNAILVQNFNDIMSQMDQILSYITIFVVFVAAISLLVGGIGVMNIMLVSVTERTREIGIRKSLGARTGSILLQFLSESAIITLLGGLIGILIGVAGAFGICSLIGFTAKVSVGTVLGASMFSSAVGIFFGIYPAKKAAKLSPIEALRHE